MWMLASGDAADSDTDDAGSASSSATDSSNGSSSGSDSSHSSSRWALHRQGMCRKQQMRTAMGRVLGLLHLTPQAHKECLGSVKGTRDMSAWHHMQMVRLWTLLRGSILHYIRAQHSDHPVYPYTAETREAARADLREYANPAATGGYSSSGCLICIRKELLTTTSLGSYAANADQARDNSGSHRRPLQVRSCTQRLRLRLTAACRVLILMLLCIWTIRMPRRPVSGHVHTAW